MSEIPFITYAQNGEDILLWRALKHIDHGFYIDVGAQDPVVDSVTKTFYERGWHGINIEPVQHWYERVVQDRPHDTNLRLAVSDQPGTLKLFEVEDSGLSTSDTEFARRHAAAGHVLHEQEVECTTLDQICKDHSVDTVHFLKIDCEGAEKSALEGISLSDIRPWIILLEATEPNSTKPAWQEWEPLLTGRGYAFVFFDGLNRYYLADEHKELASAFGAPANILDGARRIAEVKAWGRVDRLLTEIDGLKGAATNARLSAELAALTSDRDRIAVERDVAMTDRDRMAADRDHLAADRQRVAADRDRLASDRRRVAADRDRLTADRHRVAADRDALRVDRDRVVANLTALLASNSWRVTAPLRRASLALGAARRHQRRASPSQLRVAAVADKGKGSPASVKGGVDADRIMACVRQEISRR